VQLAATSQGTGELGLDADLALIVAGWSMLDTSIRLAILTSLNRDPPPFLCDQSGCFGHDRRAGLRLEITEEAFAEGAEAVGVPAIGPLVSRWALLAVDG
jgi:hypothetical protein